MFSCLLLALSADAWTEFRAHAGVGAGKPPIQWSETKNIKWKTTIPGKAWASPVALDGQVWLANATADGKQLRTVQIDFADGRIVRSGPTR